MTPEQTWIALGGLLLTNLAIAVGGGIKLWQWLQAQTFTKEELDARLEKENKDREKEFADYKLQANKLAWEQNNEWIERQSQEIDKLNIIVSEMQIDIIKTGNHLKEAEKKIDSQADCIVNLQDKFGNCDDDRERLLEENHKLKEKLNG